MNIDYLLNEKKYHKHARQLSNYVNVMSDQYDILHDIIVEALSSGKSIQACSNKIRREIIKKNELIENDVRYAKRDYRRGNFNLKACRFFDEVNDILKWKGYQQGKHATNGGEKRVGKYYVDFFVPHYDIVVEYNEPAHYYDSYRINYDFRRRVFIENVYDMPIVVVHEDLETPEQAARLIIRHIEYSVLKNNCKKF